MIVQSYGALQSYRPREQGPPPAPAERAAPTMTASSSYATMYRTQPAVRTVVDFVARNTAQLGPQVFRRVSDTDRERLVDHELAQWLANPNPDTTGYRLIEGTMQDLSVFGMAGWLKVRGRDRLGLVRLPPHGVTVEGWLMPTGFLWARPEGAPVPLAVEDVVFFRYYDPDDPLGWLSPLETLRGLLSEEAAANVYRRAFWQNAARLEGVITRPLAAKSWTPEQKQSWREQWQARYSGQPGQVAVLEDGMEFHNISSSAQEAELTASRKLTREEVAAAFHVPLPMVGILEHATFSNIREQHKNLYQDCLGPTLEMLQQEIERQLLPECDDHEDVYVEFNIADKMKGSFEEQSASLYRLVGRPIMTANEGRARLNLPSVDDPAADELAMPVTVHPTAGMPAADPQGAAALAPPVRDQAAAAIVPVIRATWDRQRARLDKVSPGSRAIEFDAARYDRELAEDLEACYLQHGAPPTAAAHAAATLARTINADTLQLLVARHDAFSDGREAALYVHA